MGLVDDERWSGFQLCRDAVEMALPLLRDEKIDGIAASDLLRRSDVQWADLAAKSPVLSGIGADIGHRVEIRMKYEGYIIRQDRQIERFAKMETRLIPLGLDYSGVVGLRNEAKQKLMKFTPRSLGQALRISGITPADVTLLAIHLDRGQFCRGQN
jgi:tRNA uridine 5-carboxymethylaminomethyl modification enzyme